VSGRASFQFPFWQAETVLIVAAKYRIEHNRRYSTFLRMGPARASRDPLSKAACPKAIDTLSLRGPAAL
jgi:hypothetical protein